VRIAKRLGPDNVSLVSGGLAMYTLLAVFPALAALVAVYGEFATPALMRRAALVLIRFWEAREGADFPKLVNTVLREFDDTRGFTGGPA